MRVFAPSGCEGVNKNHTGEARSQHPPPTPAPGTEPCAAEDTARRRQPVSDWPGGLFNERWRRAAAIARAGLQSACFSFLFNEQQKAGGRRRRRNKVCGNGHCFPERQLPCLCAVEARWGSRSPFLHQKFFSVLTEKWMCECGRKQKLNSVLTGYISCEASVACLVL